MTRTLLGSALAVAILAGIGRAQEDSTFGGSEYHANANTPVDGTCPDGNCPGGFGSIDGAHGHGLHRLGHHYHRIGPPHTGLAYASGYPNGVYNYGYPMSPHDWKGPGLGCRTCSNGECQYRFYGQPDLFYNYYAWPSCTGLGSELYISPRPVPPHVGYTYITYQPLMPHEFMYTHHRTYHRYYNGGQGLNRTHVTYRHSWFGK
jgi:hypothetical protein